MKLIRIGPEGHEIPAVLDPIGGSALSASSVTADYDTEFFGNGGLDRLREALDARSLLPLQSDNPRLGPPIKRPGKIIGIGLNYRDHAAESNMPVPVEPILFMKAPNAVIGPNDEVRIPPGSTKTDWEVELGVIIGRRASYLRTPTEALSYVAGYTVSNDISEREYQLERDGQWDKGKSCDTFNPLGPWLVTSDEIPDPQALNLWLNIDDVSEQAGHTSDMIFSVEHIVWFVSQYMVLEPGDLINTGTPSGVGLSKTPPQYLRPGQEMHLGIDGLGEQRTKTVVTPS